MTEILGAFLPGFGLGLGLIVAIGAQNAFVLRQGILRAHVFAVCLICALSDAVLIAVGVAGFGSIARAAPWFEPAMRYGGAAFLIWYGWRSLRSAIAGGGRLAAAQSADQGRGRVMLTALALTWLNPHVYLDTLVLVGAISAQYQPQMIFGLGAVCASFTFFFALGYGARLLAPVFERPRAWRILDLFIAGVMWAIAAKLLIG